MFSNNPEELVSLANSNIQSLRESQLSMYKHDD